MARNVNLPVGNHMVSVTQKGANYTVSIDGTAINTYKASATSFWISPNEDFHFQVDGIPTTLSVRKRNLRLAQNGIYLDNGQPFVPAIPAPKWIWVFFILNLLIPVFSLGGAINFLIGVMGILLCNLVATSEIKNTAVKVLLCVLVTVAAWTVFIVFMGSVMLFTNY